MNVVNRKAKHIVHVTGILFREYDGKELRDYDLVVALLSMDSRMRIVFYAVADHRVVGIGVNVGVHRVSQRPDC